MSPPTVWWGRSKMEGSIIVVKHHSSLEANSGSIHDSDMLAMTLLRGREVCGHMHACVWS